MLPQGDAAAWPVARAFHVALVLADTMLVHAGRLTLTLTRTLTLTLTRTLTLTLLRLLLRALLLGAVEQQAALGLLAQQRRLLRGARLLPALLEGARRARLGARLHLPQPRLGRARARARPKVGIRVRVRVRVRARVSVRVWVRVGLRDRA